MTGVRQARQPERDPAPGASEEAEHGRRVSAEGPVAVLTDPGGDVDSAVVLENGQVQQVPRTAPATEGTHP